MITPPYLHPGDSIGLLCPSGYMPAENYRTCISVLQQWGFVVKEGYTLGHQHHYFSGTDKERLSDLQQMLNDKDLKAIMCARGGYGLSRIIDQLDFRSFEKHPKWIIGFSDVTVLHAHINERYKIATLHAPMAAAFNDEEYNNEYVVSLQKALLGQRSDYSCKGSSYNRQGVAKGRLVGGNLALVAHLIGSRSSFNTKNKILFLEDIGEYLYNVDRMLLQLKRAGMLDKLAGMIIGKFSDLKDTTIPFGQNIHDIIQFHLKDYSYPVCFDFPVSHEKENYALKVGVRHKLTVGDIDVKLNEIS